MYGNDNSQFRLLDSTNDKPADLMATKFTQSQSSQTQSETKPPEIKLYNQVAVLIPFCTVLGFAGIFYLFSNIRKIAPRSIGIFKPSSKIPCKNCQYFKDNFYIKCAVNPTIAMTEEAKDCSDYCPQKDNSQ